MSFGGKVAGGLPGNSRKSFGRKPSPFASGAAGRSALSPSPKADAFMRAERDRAGVNTSARASDFLSASAKNAPQQTAATFNPGGKPVFGRRIVALFIDDILVWIVAAIMFGGGLMTSVAAYAEATPGTPEEAAAATTLLLYSAIYVIIRMIYGVSMEASPLQATVGKLIVGAVVVTRQQQKASFGAILMRNTLGRFVVNLVPFGIGYLIGLFSKDRICLHDLISSTMVRSRHGDGRQSVQAETFA